MKYKYNYKDICLLLLCYMLHWVNINSSSHFHISMVGDLTNDYMIDWSTSNLWNEKMTAHIYYSINERKLDKILVGHFTGNMKENNETGIACWTARVKGLALGDIVYYSSNPKELKPNQFKVYNLKETTWAVFGDLASKTQGGAAGISLPALNEALTANRYQGVLDIGDISYEFTGKNADDYMNEIEAIASSVPFFTTTGNHEYLFAGHPKFSLENYHTHFGGILKGAGENSGSFSNEYYSFNAGLIHFIFINTEVYHLGMDSIVKQTEWLEKDLKSVNRTFTPYIIMCGHRPPFKITKHLKRSRNAFSKKIIPLMDQYHVDLYFSGHVHAYYNMYATQYKSYRIPPIIVSGSAGNNEYLDGNKVNFGNFQSRFKLSKFGYGYLTATSKELVWEWGYTAYGDEKHPIATNWTLQDRIVFPRYFLPKEKKEYNLIQEVRSSYPAKIKSNDRMIFALRGTIFVFVLISMKILYNYRRQRKGYISLQ